MNDGTKKLINSKAGLRIVCVDGEFQSPFQIDEPFWVPDKQITHCKKCNIKFNFTTRKHHCRRCGLIYCHECTNVKLQLARMCFVDPVRICVDCRPQTKVENKFFDQYIKILIQGANFDLDLSSSTDKVPISCRLSSNHRYLIFTGIEFAPVDVSQILSVNVFDDNQTGCTSVDIEFESEGKIRSFRLDPTPDVQSQKTAMSWIAAIEMAFSLLKPSKLIF